jgi:hypothetical protein
VVCILRLAMKFIGIFVIIFLPSSILLNKYNALINTVSYHCSTHVRWMFTVSHMNKYAAVNGNKLHTYYQSGCVVADSVYVITMTSGHNGSFHMNLIFLFLMTLIHL